MNNSDLKLKIAVIYPNILNLFGDMGNALILKQRCNWRGINVEINEINENVSKNDIYLLFSGQNQREISSILLKDKNFYQDEMQDNSVILGVDGGYQILGNTCYDYEGLGLLDCETKQNDKRFTGNVTSKIDFLQSNYLVGFENHSGKTYLYGDTKPLANVVTGNGNNGEDKTEGARYKNVFGTYLHGPVLAQNVQFADYLISLALEKKYNDKFNLNDLNDEFETKTHEALIGKTY